jgi:hypothetical protein
MREAGQRGSEIVETIKRAYAEFLTLPSIVIAGFLVLGGVTAALDAAEVAWLSAARDFLRAHFFSDGQATSDLLGAVATGLVTLTSITISLLLIAVQQAAAAMSAQIYDQFLRRSLNQFYFGFFVGLSLYALLILSTVTDTHNPVFGATFALLLTFGALFLLILLLYTTIDQMRLKDEVDDDRGAGEVNSHALGRSYRRRTVARGRGGRIGPAGTRKIARTTRIALDTRKPGRLAAGPGAALRSRKDCSEGHEF